jgi:hypothetical protein
MRVGGYHVISIKNTNRVPNRKAISEDYTMIIKMIVFLNDIYKGQPHSIPFSIVEPGTGLPMYVYH